MDKRIIDHADRIFNKRKQDAQSWAKKVGLKKTAGAPKQGPYYWLFSPTKKRWYLETMPREGDLDTVDHPTMWKYISQDLANEYRLDPYKARTLQNLPYSMPRGRVQVVPNRRSRKNWVVYYGNDFPMTDAMKKQILNDFDLSEQWQAGLVRFLPDEHEVTIQQDLDRFKNLISLPPKEIKKIVPPKVDFDFED